MATELEKYLIELREKPIDKQQMVEIYLILYPEIASLKAVLDMMTDKELAAKSFDFQVKTLQSVIQELSLLRDFCEEMGKGKGQDLG